MIVFDLECSALGHRFEGWFASSTEFERQQRRGLVTCPQCGSDEVAKAPMAPRLGRKGNQLALARPTTDSKEPGAPAITAAAGPAMQLPPEAAAMMLAMARLQAEALKQSHWVGDKFAEDARAMHYGEKDQAPIHGEASLKDARDLLEEGIEIAPVLFPLAPPGRIN